MRAASNRPARIAACWLCRAAPLQLLSGPLGTDFAPMGHIFEVHVSSRGQFGATRLTSRDFGGAALGATVCTRTWCTRWHAPQRPTPNIVVHRPFRVIGLEQKIDTVLIRLDDSRHIEAVHSDQREGGAANGADGRPAAGDALLAELDVDGLAPAPPLSVSRARGRSRLLALPARAAARKSMIWCLDHETAQQRLRCSDADLPARSRPLSDRE